MFHSKEEKKGESLCVTQDFALSVPQPIKYLLNQVYYDCILFNPDDRHHQEHYHPQLRTIHNQEFSNKVQDKNFWSQPEEQVYTLFVVDPFDQVLGYARFYLVLDTTKENTSNHLFLNNIATESTVRGSGIGSLLIGVLMQQTNVLNEIHRGGLPYIYLYLHEDEEESQITRNQRNQFYFSKHGGGFKDDNNAPDIENEWNTYGKAPFPSQLIESRIAAFNPELDKIFYKIFQNVCTDLALIDLTLHDEVVISYFKSTFDFLFSPEKLSPQFRYANNNFHFFTFKLKQFEDHMRNTLSLSPKN